MIDVAGLGQANHGVDEHVGMVRSSSTDCQLSVRSVHGVSGLESNDSGPTQLVEVQANLGGSVYNLSVSSFRSLDLEKGIHRRSTKS